MTAKKFEHQGKKLTIGQWSKETGLAAMTIRDRLALGWTVEQALSTKPDSADNRAGLGRSLHTGILASLKKVWDAKGKEAFEKQLATSFEKDAIKTVLAFQSMLPKIVENGNNERPITAIQVNNVIDPNDLKHFKPLS